MSQGHDNPSLGSSVAGDESQPTIPPQVVVAIDDDALTLLATRRALTSAGMLCYTASNGETGLQLIRQHKPDLVLLDILLVGEDGFTICREIRRTWSPEELPVIMVTGLEDLASIKEAYEAGANDYLTKPLHWKHLPYRIRHVLKANQDVTEQRRIGNALRRSEERYQRITDAITDYIYTVRVTGGSAVETIHGPGCEAVTGYQANEFVEDPYLWFRMVANDDRPGVEEQVRRVLAGLDPSPIEHRIAHKNGTIRWVRSTFVPHRNGLGVLMAYDGLIKDITEWKQTELEKLKLQAQLQQAQKMESLGHLAGGVAHDMNNVLAAIFGMAELGIENQAPGSLGHRSFETIIKAAARGGQMVKSLLSFARQSPAEEGELDVNTILREEVRLLERTTFSKISLVMDLGPDLRLIRGDASALTHAFMNLCVNAVDAMPESGTLTLRTCNVDRNGVEVAIEDTGIGMPKEVLEKALDPFFTTKEVGKGTGLGLSMAYSTVKAHRGQMEIQSEPHKGTRVTMRFPACEATSIAPESAVESRTSSAQEKLNVLFVDDDELIQNTIPAILEILGHSVTAVFSGEDGLAKLEAGLQPNLVILDMNMPGLGGSGTLPRLRALCPTVPVLLATGRADQAAQHLIEAFPFVTLLPKPFSMKELQQHFERAGRG